MGTAAIPKYIATLARRSRQKSRKGVGIRQVLGAKTTFVGVFRKPPRRAGTSGKVKIMRLKFDCHADPRLESFRR
jgi:hypothetical protein